ncbi:MAG: hypothetical protein ACTSU0_12280, partial [Alphaproteobacteria bacterium]
MRATHYDLITHSTPNGADFIERLKACGAYDKTLIVIASDHSVTATVDQAFSVARSMTASRLAISDFSPAM